MTREGSSRARTIGVAAVITGIAATLALPVVLRSQPAEAAELAKFDDCVAMRAYLEESAAASGARGMAGEVFTTGANRQAVAESGAAAAPPQASAAAAADGAGGGGDTGSTNVQVAGVDELDVTDTDGRLIVAVGDALTQSPGPVEKFVDDGAVRPDIALPQGTLRLLDPAAGRVLDAEAVAGTGARLTWDTASRVVWVTSQDYVNDGAGGPLTRIARVRLDGEALTVDGATTIRGNLVGARRVGSALHVVASDSGGPFPVPVPLGGGGSGVAEDAVQDPAVSVPPAPSRLPFEGGDVTLACDQVWRPAGPSQPSAIMVASFDAGAAPSAGTLEPLKVAEVAGAGSLLYGTAQALYVATTLWEPFPTDGSGPTPGPDGTQTSIHRFTLDDLRWTGSGRVPGIPLNQFAFDEHEAVLRVATTVDRSPGFAVPEPDVGQPDVAVDSGSSSGGEPAIAPPVPTVDNMVLTLDTDGDLEEMGRLSGLGEPGERIQGVRFSQKTGYVVTFRQTDPLYVVDLSDPKSPSAAGELHLPGFSSYLHPVGDGLVVGIGRAGTEDGRLQGAQAQLFDVADPRSPRLVDQEPLGADSPAGNDHLAFADLGESRFAVPSVDWPDRPDFRTALPAQPGPAQTEPVQAGSVQAGPGEPGTGEVPPSPPVSDLPAPVPPELQAPPPAVAVVKIEASAGGLTRTAQFVLEAPASVAYQLASGPIRTMTIGDRVAVVAGSHGVALFEADGRSAGWLLF